MGAGVGNGWTITVYLKGSVPEKILAEWDPGLPDWLRDEEF